MPEESKSLPLTGVGLACSLGFIWLVHGQVARFVQDPTSVAVEFKTVPEQAVIHVKIA